MTDDLSWNTPPKSARNARPDTRSRPGRVRNRLVDARRGRVDKRYHAKSDPYLPDDSNQGVAPKAHDGSRDRISAATPTKQARPRVKEEHDDGRMSSDEEYVRNASPDSVIKLARAGLKLQRGFTKRELKQKCKAEVKEETEDEFEHSWEAGDCVLADRLSRSFGQSASLPPPIQDDAAAEASPRMPGAAELARAELNGCKYRDLQVMAKNLGRDHLKVIGGSTRGSREEPGEQERGPKTFLKS